MIDKKLLSKTEEDSIGDFNDIYDFKTVFDSALTYNDLKKDS
jgi:uncharacterized repeat protein (TIGR04138 family)